MSPLPDSASPLYEKVKTYILNRIGSGAWEANSKIPSENELVATLGISRMTVHRALRELTGAGLLMRVQGVGTFVAPPRPQAGLLEINNIALEITTRGHAHRAEVIALETIATTPELQLSFEDGSLGTVFHSVVVHYENGESVQLEERFINPLLVPEYGAQDFTLQTTYDYLVGATPITDFEHIISAVAADGQTATHLGIAAGAPCLLLKRCTWTGDRVATVNRLTYVGARYTLGGRMRAKG